jgi:hypothetical protein
VLTDSIKYSSIEPLVQYNSTGSKTGEQINRSTAALDSRHTAEQKQKATAPLFSAGWRGGEAPRTTAGALLLCSTCRGERKKEKRRLWILAGGRFLRARGHARCTPRVSSTRVVQIWYALSSPHSVHSRASICGCVCGGRAMPALFMRC